MKKTTLRIFAFTILIAIIVILNMIVFRSQEPMYWIITLILSVLFLIVFPYKTFFKKPNQK